MKLKQYLKESVIIVSYKDLPDWVKGVMNTKKMKKDVEVNIGKEVSLPSAWHDADVMETFAYKNGKVTSQLAIGGQSINDNPKERALKKGFKLTLKPGEMILVTHTYPKMAKLYAHPDDMNKAMLAEPEKTDLTPEEIMTLGLTKGLKAFARKEEALKYGIQFDEVKQSLIKKGYLSKNGSINTKGKNFLIQWSGKSFIQDHEIASRLGLKRGM